MLRRSAVAALLALSPLPASPLVLDRHARRPALLEVFQLAFPADGLALLPTVARPGGGLGVEHALRNKYASQGWLWLLWLHRGDKAPRNVSAQCAFVCDSLST